MKTAFASRRMFMGASVVFGLGAVVYLQSGPSKTVVYTNEVQVILHACYHLFPSSDLGPGAVDLKISGYLAGVLADKRLSKDDKDYFFKGARWLEESSYEVYEKSFLNLNKDEKEKLFQRISKERWGENFIYTCLNYIFEAMLSAPVYGSNINEIGWKWLEHNPGFPQPLNKEDINYEI